MSKSLKIGLDYDGTCTEDPATWKEVVKILTAAGHKVYIVTMRYREEGDFIHEWKPLVDGICFTGRMAKRPYIETFGIDIDIWIDDHPRAVNEDAAAIFTRVLPKDSTSTDNINTVKHQRKPIVFLSTATRTREALEQLSSGLDKKTTEVSADHIDDMINLDLEWLTLTTGGELMANWSKRVIAQAAGKVWEKHIEEAKQRLPLVVGDRLLMVLNDTAGNFQGFELVEIVLKK